MTKSSLNTQRETIMHYWNINVRSAKEIYIATKIPMRTIYNNLKKLERNNGKLNRKKGSGRPKKISPGDGEDNRPVYTPRFQYFSKNSWS